MITIFKDPNVLRPTGNFGVKPRQPVPIRCPHCRNRGAFAVLTEQNKATQYSKETKELVAPGAKNYKHETVHASIRHCPNPKCLGIVLIVEIGNEVEAVHPPELVDFNDENLPENIRKTLTEAVQCHGAGAYRAAAIMVRRLLEEICEANEAAGENLHERLKSLKTKVVLPEPLFDAMTALKALGNDATHVKARAYDEIGKAEAEDSIELAKEIVKSLYQLQGLVKRLEDRKNRAS